MELELRSHGQSCMSVYLSRTVSLQVPLYLVRSELSKDGDDGDGVPDSVYRRSKETSGFSLCAAPSQNSLRLNLREVEEYSYEKTRERETRIEKCLS